MPFNYCCNPFGLPRHTFYTKGVRPIAPVMRDKFPILRTEKFICARCRVNMNCKQPPKLATKFDFSVNHQDNQVAAGTLNSTPFLSNNVEQKTSSSSDVRSPESASEDFTLHVSTSDTSFHEPITPLAGQRIDFDVSQTSTQSNVKPGNSEFSVVSMIKEKLPAINGETCRMGVLTLHPQEWSARRLAREYRISPEMACRGKQLIVEKGALGNANPTVPQLFNDRTISLVKDIYRCDDMSRPMTDLHDFVRVRTENGKIHLRKRLVLSNLNELYSTFREHYPTVQASFSQFAELQPRECRFEGHSGTHCFSTCLKHENVRLMIEGARFDSLIPALSLRNYEDFLAKLICNPPRLVCYLGKCSECPGTKSLRSIIDDLLENTTYVELTVRRWCREGLDERIVLINRVISSDRYINCLLEDLETLLPHDFISTQQRNYFQTLKDNLQEGEFLVASDFSQNYEFVSHNSLRRSYLDENAATIHPFVVYYKLSDGLHTFNHVVISESLFHNPIAVNLFQKKLHDSLRQHFPVIKKVYYFADSAEYRKRKTFVNLCLHYEDFGYPAELHFFAESHGKRPCDMLSGTLRREATRASLEKTESITTARDLYEFARDHFFNITFSYCTNSEYNEHEDLRAKRYSGAYVLSGRAKLLNAFAPISKTQFQGKLYSFADEYETYDFKSP